MDKDEIKKQYYTIGEVSALLAIPSSKIRYWETEFKELSPKKNKKGNRVYTPKDIELLGEIQDLLKVKKFTIQGAKDYLHTHFQSTHSKNTEFIQPIMPIAEEKSQERDLKKIKQTLTKIRSFLLEIKKSL